MSLNTSDPIYKEPSSNVPFPWLKRLIIAATILAFIAIGSVVLYVISLIFMAVVLLILSALLAYLIYPLVQFLQRRLPRTLAITIAYLLAASALAVGIYIMVASFVPQALSFVQSIPHLLHLVGEQQTHIFPDMLRKLGITNDQVTMFENQLFSQAQGALSGVLPFLNGLFNNTINLIVIITLSVYFVLDGPRIIRWLSRKTPVSQRGTINFLLRTLNQSLGGYFRGSLQLALIGALCTGIGLALLSVPYATLLGVLFFFLYFVPVIGAYIIGVLCILAALPQGWIVTLIVVIFMTFLQGIVIGQILSPRIFSKAVGVHPIVALFALFAGGALFGLLGGFLAVPIAGIFQQITVAIWHRWQNEHPEQFPPE